MYCFAQVAETPNLLGAAGPEVCADALERMAEAALQVDGEQIKGGYGIILNSDKQTEEGRAAGEMLREILRERSEE